MEELSTALNNGEIDEKFFMKLDWDELKRLIERGHLNNPVISKIKSLFR